MSFGNRLRNLRLEMGLTQEELAKKLNVSRATVGRYETNERFPDKNILNSIADIFKVSIDYLLERTDEKDLGYKKDSNNKHIKNNICKKIENEVIERLTSENIITTEEYIPEDILKNIIEYGIEAAIKIAKIEKDQDK